MLWAMLGSTDKNVQRFSGAPLPAELRRPGQTPATKPLSQIGVFERPSNGLRHLVYRKRIEIL